MAILKYLKLVYIAISGLLLLSCNSAVETRWASQGNSFECISNNGAYFLPKKLMKVIVTGSEDGAGYGISISDGDITNEPSDRPYCLDFIYSGIADNKIEVLTNKKTSLLELISTKSTDKGKQTALRVTEGLTNLAASATAGSPSFDLRGGSIGDTVSENGAIVYFEFDPFNKREMTLVNSSLRRFGYCMHFDTLGDPFIPNWHPGLCNRVTYNKDSITYPNGYYKQQIAKGRKNSERAVLYKPDLSHRVKLYRKKDAYSVTEKWKLVGSEHITMPNRAPIFALQIERAHFVDSAARVEFDNGMIHNLAVAKKSELNALADIPLFVIKSVLDIPARSLAIFQNEAENRRILIETNKQLIETIKKYNDDVLLDQALAQGKVSVGDVVLKQTATNTTVNQPTGVEANTQTGSTVTGCFDDEGIIIRDQGVEACQTAIAEGN